jgi:hypothetical protein
MKVALLALLLVCLPPFAQATCYVDIIDEGIPPFPVGTYSCYTLTACCGTAPYNFTIASGTIPVGLSFNGAGKLYGTATTVTTNNIVCIKVTDAASCHVTKCFYIEAE